MSIDRAELGSELEWLYQNTTSIDYADVLAVYDSGYVRAYWPACTRFEAKP